jgi:hypothetical protein
VTCFCVAVSPRVTCADASVLQPAQWRQHVCVGFQLQRRVTLSTSSQCIDGAASTLAPYNYSGDVKTAIQQDDPLDMKSWMCLPEHEYESLVTPWPSVTLLPPWDIFLLTAVVFTFDMNSWSLPTVSACICLIHKASHLFKLLIVKHREGKGTRLAEANRLPIMAGKGSAMDSLSASNPFACASSGVHQA